MMLDTLMVMDVDILTKRVSVARFRLRPLGLIGVVYGESEYPYDDIADILRQATIWQTYDRNSILLIPDGAMSLEWSSFFSCYVKRENGREKLVSYCGPFDGFHLEPVSDKIKLYSLSGKFIDMIEKNPIERELEETILNKEEWDWMSSAAIAHLFNRGLCSETNNMNGVPVLKF